MVHTFLCGGIRCAKAAAVCLVMKREITLKQYDVSLCSVHASRSMARGSEHVGIQRSRISMIHHDSAKRWQRHTSAQSWRVALLAMLHRGRSRSSRPGTISRSTAPPRGSTTQTGVRTTSTALPQGDRNDARQAKRMVKEMTATSACAPSTWSGTASTGALAQGRRECTSCHRKAMISTRTQSMRIVEGVTMQDSTT